MTTPTAGIVLAAGAGRRYGSPKALVSYRGTPLVVRAARLLREASCAPVLIVVGAAEEQVRTQLREHGIRDRPADGHPVDGHPAGGHPADGHQVVSNPQWPSGMGSSLRRGLDQLTRTTTPAEACAVVVIPVDMPGLTPEAVRRVTQHAGQAALTAASFAGRRSHPVLLGRQHWAGVRASAHADTGARDYLRACPPELIFCDDVAIDRDVDRPADLAWYTDEADDTP